MVSVVLDDEQKNEVREFAKSVLMFVIMREQNGILNKIDLAVVLETIAEQLRKEGTD